MQIMDTQQLYKQILEDLPFLMQSNIDDDLEFDHPTDNLKEYCDLILHEIQYERDMDYEVYSKDEMDKLEQTVNNVKEQL